MHRLIIKTSVVIFSLIAMCNSSFASPRIPEPVITEVIEETAEEVVEPIIIEPFPEPVQEIKEEPSIYELTGLTDEEINLIALVTMAEAEGESEYGKRLVIDTILNRVESSKFPNTVHKVIYQKSQFSSMWNGRVDKCFVMDSIRELVIEEAQSKANSEVLFFTAGKYGKYGTPMFVEGNHYFSK